jgi:serine/threonine-protein kinase
MLPVYCSQGHANAPNNRFCLTCGEKLAAMQAGTILGNRYRIVSQIGHGGFGRTYLAEDVHRFNEICVLKEFAPQVQGNYALEKAEELFEREAGVLYKLNHPQIPRFRELFRATLEGQDRLFLVQDYVAGQTYRQLLEAHRQRSSYFSELEIRQLLEQILPVLQYLHSVGVIHRDISPDNLILRSSDQLPVLIDFGGVKQVAAAATSKYTSSAEAVPVTRLGKVGYAPEEQMRQGIASPESDLYALAVTALVLLTGKEPADLLDLTGRSHPWKQLVSLSPDLTALLTQMLAANPAQRFASAQAVLQALRLCSPLPAAAFPAAVSLTPPPASTPLAISTGQGRKSQSVTGPLNTVPVNLGQGTGQTLSPTFPTPPSPHSPTSSWFRSLLFLLLPLALLAGAGWWWRDLWLPRLEQISQVTPVEPSQQSPLEAEAQAAKVNFGFLVKLANATFDQRYPDQAGRILTSADTDAQWRQNWLDIANEWLKLLQQHLSSEARQKLGSYTEADRNQWKQTINQLYVGSRSLYDLTDAQFFHLFPRQRGKEFLNQPIGQVWHGIAVDQIRALQSGKTLERIEFEPGQFSKQVEGELEPGGGRVYLANLSAEQIMRLNLQAPSQSSLLSIYLPRPTKEQPFLLEDSTDLTWAGTLPQSGYYEIVVVNTADQPIRYQLSLAVDNVTSTPVQPEKAEAPEAKD